MEDNKKLKAIIREYKGMALVATKNKFLISEKISGLELQRNIMKYVER